MKSFQTQILREIDEDRFSIFHRSRTWTQNSSLTLLNVFFSLSQDMNNSKLFSDEAANIYERAIGTLLKKNMLLYFSFADYEEVSVQLLIQL